MGQAQGERPDFARMALAFNSMRRRPDPGLAAAMQGRIDQRQQASKINKTAEYLRSKGMVQEAEMLERGLLSPSQIGPMLLPQQQDPIKGVEIDGRLVNPYTGELMADFSGGQDEMSAAEEKIARLESLGVPRDMAIKAADNILIESRDPRTGELIIFDPTTQQVIFGPGAQSGAAISDDQQAPPASPVSDTFVEAYGDAPDAFGAEGFIRRGINTVSDVIGVGTPFPEVQQTQSDFNVLRERLISDISRGYDRQPPAFLLRNIQDLTPQAGRLFEGPGEAQTKLRAIGRDLQGEIETTRQMLERRMSPTEREKRETQLAQLQVALGRVQSALSGFEDTGSDVAPPSVGEVMDGYRFLGGDPGEEQSWEKVQ